MGYELVEEPLFTSQLQEIADIRHVDAALTTLSNALQRNPTKFQFVTDNLRIAKTEPYQRDNVFVPSLRIYFTVDEERKQVILKYIETIEFDFDF